MTFLINNAVMSNALIFSHTIATDIFNYKNSNIITNINYVMLFKIVSIMNISGLISYG